jgi:hypothetical protein
VDFYVASKFGGGYESIDATLVAKSSMRGPNVR